MVFCGFPVLGLLVLLKSTSRYIFDGRSVSCLWLGRYAIWREQLEGLKHVACVPALKGNLPMLKLEWGDYSQSVTLTRDIEMALRK